MIDDTLGGAAIPIANANITRFTNATKPNVTINGGGSYSTNLVSTGINFLALNLANAVSAESLGTVSLQAGLTIFNAGYTAAQAAGATSKLNFAGLTRAVGATLSINANTLTVTYQPLNQTTNQILFPTASFPTASLFLGTNGSTTNGILGNGTSNILPYAEVGGAATGGATAINTGDFAATYISGANIGFVALPSTAYYLATTAAQLNDAPATALVDFANSLAAGTAITWGTARPRPSARSSLMAFRLSAAAEPMSPSRGS